MDGDADGAGEPGTRVPVDGREYPVVLGRSLLAARDVSERGEEPSEVYTTFRYDFQPASIDKSSPGLVSMDESKGVQVLLASATGAPGGVLFKGKMSDNKDTDCLLLFDGERFRLERCPFSCTQLRHVRASTATKRKIDSALAESSAVVAAPGAGGKSLGGKKTKARGRPRGRPPKVKQDSKATAAPKRPRAVATKAATSPSPAADASLPPSDLASAEGGAPSS